MILRLDYEWYSELDVTEVGVWTVAMHPSTEILLAGFQVDDGPVRVWRCTEVGKILSSTTRDLMRAIADADEIWAFNAQAERSMTECVLTRQLGVKAPDVSVWHCTQVLAAMHGYPFALDKCAQALNLESGKDKKGKELINRFSKPRKPTKADPRTRILPTDDPVAFKEFAEYCAQDVRVEGAVHAALPTQKLPCDEQQVYTVDSTINSYGVLVDVPLARGAMKVSNRHAANAGPALSKATNGRITSGGQGARFKAEFARLGWPCATLDKEELALLVAKNPPPPEVAHLLELRAGASKTSIQKYAKLLTVMGPDSRVRGGCQMNAAHTTRWGGRFVQWQNLPRPNFDTHEEHEHIRQAKYDHLSVMYPNPTDALRDSLRNVVVAPSGKTLVIGDWAGIEARVLGWLAEEPGYMEAFRTNLDLYVLCASVIYGVPYDQVTKEMRKLGKAAILGLGYSMWEKTFIDTCRRNGITIKMADDKLICKATRAYRDKYTRITGFWDKCEQAMGLAIITGKTQVVGRIKFGILNGHAWIRCPSGKKLWYPEATATIVEKWGRRKFVINYRTALDRAGEKAVWWVRHSTYGGRIVENIVQKTARDLLAHTLILCDEDPRVDVVLHVHDEIVAEADIGTPTTVLEELMLDAPDWADGLPLAAEVFSSPFFKKGD